MHCNSDYLLKVSTQHIDTYLSVATITQKFIGWDCSFAQSESNALNLMSLRSELIEVSQLAYWRMYVEITLKVLLHMTTCNLL